MPADWAIQTFDLTKYFPATQGWRSLFWRQPADHPAVDHVNLAIRPGELFGLLGPNGAGKTTLIKMLATLVLPSSGTARVNGYELRREADVRKSLGLATSDERSFFWRLTGRQNLEFFARLNGLNRQAAAEATAEGLEQVGLTSQADQAFANYSTGMRQRLAIARALLGRPALLFLDEPTKGLDPTATRQVQRLIRDELTSTRGLTVFLTTHDLNEAQQICDRLAIMHQGRILAAGSVAELRHELGDIERYRLWVTALPEVSAARLGQAIPNLRLREAGPTLAPARPDGPNGQDKDGLATVVEFETVPGDLRLNQAIDLLREAHSQIQRVEVEQLSLETIFERLTTDGPTPHRTTAERSTQTSREAGGKFQAERKASLARHNPLNVVAAFLRRDLQVEISYRFAFLLQIFGVFFTVGVFYFLSLLLGDAALPYLEAYGGDYFAFVIIGIAFSGYFGVGISSFADRLRTAQTTGTLEAMLSTPTSLSMIVSSSALWDFLMVTFRVFVFLAVGAGLLGMQLKTGSLPGALALLTLTIGVFSSLGILAASFIMVIKRGDPITWAFTTLSTLLGGVYYPLAVLPEPLLWIARLLPITYALEGMRKALLQGAGLADLLPEILALSVFAVILVPGSLLAFRFAVRRAKTDGSLTHY